MIIVYGNMETDFNNNGLAVLDAPIRAQVEERINGLYTIELEYPFDERGKYLNIAEDNIIKAPTPQGDQLFRIYQIATTLYSIIAYGRHIFYDLLDNFIEDARPESQNGAAALDWILSHTQYPHSFKCMSDIGTVGTAYYVRKNPVDCLIGDMDNSFIKVWGGEIVRDNFNIQMLSARGTDRGVSIAYGKNLKSIEKQLLLDDVVTRVMPTGLDDKNQTLILPEKYIDSPNINAYAHPKIREFHFQDITVSDTLTIDQAYNALRQKVSDLFNINKVDIPGINYKVDFQELSQTEEYKDYAQLQRVYLGDTVTIKVENPKIDVKAKMLSYKYDCILESYDEVELGNFFKPSTADTFNSLNNSVSQIGNTIETQKSDLLKAMEVATQILTGVQGGYVYYKRDAGGQPQEIYIMDSPSPSTAQKCLRMNYEGIGGSKTGINGPFTLGMLIDGTINASVITTGQLSAELIKAGYLRSKDGSTWINMDNGTFSFGGKINWDGSNFTISADTIKAAMGVTGVTNLIKNSNFKLGFSNWWFYGAESGGNWYLGPMLDGRYRGFYPTTLGKSTAIYQSIHNKDNLTMSKNTDYYFSCVLRAESATKGASCGIEIWNNGNAVNYIDFGGVNADGRKLVQCDFKITNDFDEIKFKVTHYGVTDYSGAYVTFVGDLMLASGSNYVPWCPSPDEIHTVNVDVSSSDGLVVRNGNISIRNNNNVEVFKGDINGNLNILGDFTIGGQGGDTAYHTKDCSKWSKPDGKYALMNASGAFINNGGGERPIKSLDYGVVRPGVKNGSTTTIVLPPDFQGMGINQDFTVICSYGNIDSSAWAQQNKDAVRTIFVNLLSWNRDTRELVVQPCLQKIGIETKTMWGWDANTTTPGNTIGEGAIDVIVVARI
ncbi:phage tail spike protein [Clostridium manihotivorum]|uniref:Tail spike domain-containing protein n=1 Tax=Clostridium manihotivorum TaxID=2320868 RepID=A0A3R5QSF7_9CLOT|nr:phage tail spike protein [Clostridium manihotivorum]QAA31251.1 hypothetical protein C1I91_06095 [Clostridium manihotivorum]